MRNQCAQNVMPGGKKPGGTELCIGLIRTRYLRRNGGENEQMSCCRGNIMKSEAMEKLWSVMR